MIVWLLWLGTTYSYSLFLPTLHPLVKVLSLQYQINNNNCSNNHQPQKDARNQDAIKIVAKIINHKRCPQPTCKNACNQDAKMHASFDLWKLLRNHWENRQVSKNVKIHATKMQRYMQPRCEDTCTNAIPKSPKL